MLKEEDRHLPSLQIEKKFSNKPVLIIADYYGASYKSYSMFFGINWIGGIGNDLGKKYSTTLLQVYPQNYIFNGWNNLFNYWDGAYSYINLLKKYQKVYLYVGDKQAQANLEPQLNGINRQTDTKTNEIFTNSQTNESIYEVNYDSIAFINGKLISCNAEVTDSSGNYFIENNSTKFGNGITRSQEKARTGKYSSKLTKDEPYGMTCYLSEVQKGEHYVINVWKYNNQNTKAGLIINSNESKDSYLNNSTSNIVVNNWQKLTIDLLVTDVLINKNIIIYCYNGDPLLPAYFDDLTIEKIVN